MNDVLSAKRYKAMYRKENLYIVVSYKNSVPCEVFADHATNMDYSLQYMMANIDALTRITSLALKEAGFDKTVEQLERSSRQPGDLPDIIAKSLKGEQVCM